MVQSSNQRLTLKEFLALPEGDITYEFVNGEAVPKYKDNEMSIHRLSVYKRYTFISK